MNYPVVIHKDADSDYGASFPDLPGCVTAGATINETLQAAVEAAELYLEDMLLDGEPLSKAGTVDDYFTHPDYADAIFWSTVAIDITKLNGNTKRINITVPERSLAIIDKYAQSHNQSRSAFMVAATLEKIYA